MNLHGWCERCRKVRVVSVNSMGYAIEEVRAQQPRSLHDAAHRNDPHGRRVGHRHVGHDQRVLDVRH